MPSQFPKTRRPLLAALLGVCVALLAAAPSRAQLREAEVLVVYDSRIPDSLAVAEYYAGSAKVPGGAGALPGVHSRARVVDLSTLPNSAGFAAAVADIDYPTFISQLRDPLRAYLTANKLSQQIRSIVLTKGLPHRLQNIGVTGNSSQPPTIGDNPGQINAAFSGGFYGNLTYASVDSELCLLWQSLSYGENGAVADSKADGWILNPYWRSNQSASLPACPIDAWPSAAIAYPKTFVLPSVAKYSGYTGYDGLEWFNTGTAAGTSSTLTPGDLYLVCRLDGNTIAAVKSMIDRAQNLVVPMNTATVVLDKDAALYGTCPQCYPLDNQGPAEVNAFAGLLVSPPAPPYATQIYNASDYYLTKSLLLSDARLNAANVKFNDQSGIAQFFVGNTLYPGFTNVVTTPVILVASLGANHDSVYGTPASTTYATSFNLSLPGAVFNSLESYNGRAYGGIGQNPFVAQQQTADFLAAGGTFAIGNVWEPLADTVADNEQLVRNFLLGNLSWAEAAYTSLPVLSWQQIVLGDPLARVRRDREDINADGQTNIDDLYAWKQTPVNLNNTGTADNTDFLLLESTVRANELVNMKGDQR